MVKKIETSRYLAITEGKYKSYFYNYNTILIGM
jgi:hypothetical protein